jgi:hypothetical protein
MKTYSLVWMGLIPFLFFGTSGCQQTKGGASKPPLPAVQPLPPLAQEPRQNVQPEGPPEEDGEDSRMEIHVTSYLQAALDKGGPASDWKDKADHYQALISGLPRNKKEVSIERLLIQNGDVLSKQPVPLASSDDGGTPMLISESLDFTKYPALAPITVTYNVGWKGGKPRALTYVVLRNFIVEGRVDLEEQPLFNSIFGAAAGSSSALEMDHLIFLPSSKLVTEGKDISLKIRELRILEKASIVSFDRPIENGMSGGHIKIRADIVSGRLRLDLHGQKGAPGVPGANHLAEDRPPKGVDALGTRRLRTIISAGCGADTHPCREVVECTLLRAAQNGIPGFKGLSGGNGFPGGNGGDLDIFWNRTTSENPFDVSLKTFGGLGGDPGLGGEGGLPGEPGNGFQAGAECSFAGGTAAPKGAPGEPGHKGPQGQDGNYFYRP